MLFHQCTGLVGQRLLQRWGQVGMGQEPEQGQLTTGHGHSRPQGRWGPGDSQLCWPRSCHRGTSAGSKAADGPVSRRGVSSACQALPKSNFTSALFDDSSPNHQDCRNILNTEAPTLACTTELRLCDKLDNTVNSVCVLHNVSVTKQGSLAPYQPG